MLSPATAGTRQANVPFAYFDFSPTGFTAITQY